MSIYLLTWCMPTCWMEILIFHMWTTPIFNIKKTTTSRSFSPNTPNHQPKWPRERQTPPRNRHLLPPLLRPQSRKSIPDPLDLWDLFTIWDSSSSWPSSGWSSLSPSSLYSTVYGFSTTRRSPPQPLSLTPSATFVSTSTLFSYSSNIWSKSDINQMHSSNPLGSVRMPSLPLLTLPSLWSSLSGRPTPSLTSVSPPATSPSSLSLRKFPVFYQVFLIPIASPSTSWHPLPSSSLTEWVNFAHSVYTVKMSNRVN